jgi:hypothetical protein
MKRALVILAGECRNLGEPAWSRSPNLRISSAGQEKRGVTVVGDDRIKWLRGLFVGLRLYVKSECDACAAR